MGPEYPMPETGDETVEEVAEGARDWAEHAGEQRPAAAHQFHGGECGVGTKQRAPCSDKNDGSGIGRNTMAGEQALPGLRLQGREKEFMALFEAQNRTDGLVAKSAFAIVEQHGTLFFIHWNELAAGRGGIHRDHFPMKWDGAPVTPDP